MKTLKALLMTSVGIAVLIAAPIGLYMYERGLPASKYFNYYGVLSTKNSYVFPEYIEMNTFGTSDKPREFRLGGWMTCADISYIGEVDYESEYKLDGYEVTRKNWSISAGNMLPEAAQRLLDDGRSFANIDDELRDALAKEPPGFRTTWQYGVLSDGQLDTTIEGVDARPLRDGECYITISATTKTPIFKIPKTTTIDTNQFSYRYEYHK